MRVERPYSFPRGWGEFSRTRTAAIAIVSSDRHVAWRLKRLLIETRGRNPGQAGRWTHTWFHDPGLHQLMGTIRHPPAE